MRLISDDGCAYVVWGWSLADVRQDAARVQRSLDRFSVRPHQAVDVAQLPEYQRDGCALVLNEIGLQYHARGDDVAALDFVRSAATMAPSCAPCVINYVEVLSKLDRSDEALRYLEQRKSLYGENIRFEILKAKLLIQKGDLTAARAVYANLIGRGFSDDAIVLTYIELAVASKAYDEALATISGVMEKRPTIFLQRWQAGLYALKGDTTKAIELFEAMRTRYPDDMGVAVDLAGAYECAKRYQDAIAITQKLIDSGKQDESLFTTHSRILLGLGRSAEAKQTLERAHELYPASESITDTLKVVSSQLGEGDNSGLKKSIEAVAVPEAVNQAIDQADRSATAAAADSDAEELVRIVGIRYEDGKPLLQDDNPTRESLYRKRRLAIWHAYVQARLGFRTDVCELPCGQRRTGNDCRSRGR